MVSERDMEGNKETGNPVVLSEGASVALGNVFKRISKPRARDRTLKKSTGKRPRPSPSTVVLTANEEVREALKDQKQEKKRYKEARKAKLQFENNGRVIPDAATNAAMEKELLMTATKGAVALFNAVSKAQKTAEETADKPKKKSGPPISRDSFMNMMRAGVAKGDRNTQRKDKVVASDSEQSSDAPKSKAKWLKDDFLTARSKTLRDWDREAAEDYEVDPAAEKDEDGQSSGSDEDNSSESSGDE